MKQKDIIKAYKAIEKYEQKPIPLKASYALFKTKKLIQDQIDFQNKEEREIYKKYKPTPQEDGSLKFDSQEKAVEFAKEFDAKIKEIIDIDVDLGEFKKFKIPVDQIIDISVEDIEALEPFIDFEE